MALPVGPVNPFSVGKLVDSGPSSPSSSGGTGFGQMLADSIGKLDQAQASANQQVQGLATGTAKDLSSVVMSVEQASLEVQLAAQIRNKAVDAYNDIFRMQI
jgi:flagellar hook-basal body complex protein FliE